jgi:hypothetical protein
MASLGEREGRLDGDDAEFAIAQESRDKSPFVADEVVRLAGGKDVLGIRFSTNGHAEKSWRKPWRFDLVPHFCGEQGLDAPLIERVMACRVC